MTDPTVTRVDARGLAAVARGEASLVVDGEARRQVNAARAALDTRIAEGRRIYGATTGYGPLAGTRVSPEHAERLQQGLIDHLASGVGPPLPADTVRATMAARLAALAQGWSGVRVEVVDHLAAMLNAGIVPEVPEAGTVGASGDLTPLAHIALAATGRGRVLGGGDAADALASAGLAPIRLTGKDGLALVNGTAAMAGTAALNSADAANAIALAARLTALYAECMGGRADAFDPRFGAARPHPGQQTALHWLQTLIAGSERVHPADPVPPRLQDTPATGEPPQDPYTIRCAPQDLGAALDALAHHDGVLATELHSATDNPLVDPETGHILHGGNFYGQHLAYVSDLLNAVLVKLAQHAERALARLTDTTRNGELPPFLHGGEAGLNSGFMGAQVSATALAAEMRTRAGPVSVHTLPTNGDNQDVVTLGTLAARTVREQLDRLYRVLAIHALALTQAVELHGEPTGFAPAGRAVTAPVREISAPLTVDRPLADDIAATAAMLRTRRWTPDVAGTPDVTGGQPV